MPAAVRPVWSGTGRILQASGAEPPAPCNAGSRTPLLLELELMNLSATEAGPEDASEDGRQFEPAVVEAPEEDLWKSGELLQFGKGVRKGMH